MDYYGFYTGKILDAYEYFGCHFTPNGAIFRTFAPAAEKIAVIGDFNNWSDTPMQRTYDGNFWECEIPGVKEEMKYKYRIYQKDGRVTDHTDPYGTGMEMPPQSATVVRRPDSFAWKDSKWMTQRTDCRDSALNIYEVHLGSWMTKEDGTWYSYSEIARPLVSYVEDNGYNYIEFMPLAEHPCDNSWGYQQTGFYSPTARYGSPDELKYLINYAHQHHIGVILDFVPVHFAVDDYGLAYYDGTALYEYPHVDVGYSEWGSKNFIHSRGEVASFLQSAAAYWLDRYHFDGLRMDAVSRLIYWQGDENRGENERAIDFLKGMNSGLKKRFPSCMLIAEDSTAYPKVTAPVENGGLGFDYKWDLGWMNDTLDYFKSAPWERHDRYHKLTFSMMYCYQEHYILSFSHDEVVHGKATILQKMWGDYEGKFPQARALYLYMMTHPGKKLNFMGNEIGHLREWDEKREQDWFILRYPNHDAFFHYMKNLDEVYDTHRSLWDGDYDPRKFLWLEVHGEEKCVYAYLRGGLVNRDAVVAANPEDEKLMWRSPVADRTVSVFNFSDVPVKDYTLRLPAPMRLVPLLSSDSDIYGGSTTDALPVLEPQYDSKEKTWKVTLDIPPFTGLLYSAEWIAPEKPKKSPSKNKKKKR